MKLKDVKVGMRVAHLDCDGNVVGCANVKKIGEHGTILLEGVGTFDAVYLRKVKPKRSVSFDGYIKAGELGCGSLLVPNDYHVMDQLAGKRVRVTLKEIK